MRRLSACSLSARSGEQSKVFESARRQLRGSPGEEQHSLKWLRPKPVSTAGQIVAWVVVFTYPVRALHLLHLNPNT